MYLTRLTEMGFIQKWMDEALGNEYNYCDTRQEIVASHGKGLEALNMSNISMILGMLLVGLVVAGIIIAGELSAKKNESRKKM